MTSLDYINKVKEIDPDRERGGMPWLVRLRLRQLEKEENASSPHTKGEQ